MCIYIISHIFYTYIFFFTYILCENYKFCRGRYPANAREKKNQKFKASELGLLWGNS